MTRSDVDEVKVQPHPRLALRTSRTRHCRWLAWGPRNIAHRIRAFLLKRRRIRAYIQPQAGRASLSPNGAPHMGGERRRDLLSITQTRQSTRSTPASAPEDAVRAAGAPPRPIPPCFGATTADTARVTRRPAADMRWDGIWICDGGGGGGGGERPLRACFVCGAPASVRRRRVARRTYEKLSKLQYGSEHKNRFCHASTRRSPICYTSIFCSAFPRDARTRFAVKSGGQLIGGSLGVSSSLGGSILYAQPSRHAGNQCFEMCSHTLWAA